MRVVIVAAGDLVPDDVRRIHDAGLVIAADGGSTTLDRLGLRPDLIVGDLDSADTAIVERMAAAGTTVERLPAAKDASDTELALDAAIAAGATEVVLLGALGGTRLDHELANLMLLADPARAGVDVRLVHGTTSARVLTAGRVLRLEGATGDVVTLLPLGRDAVGVTTRGLRWVLEAATLAAGRSRGLSNEITDAPASVSLAVGALLVIEIAQQKGSSS